MLFINNSARLFTIRERVGKSILKCDLIPGENNIDNAEIISMLRGSFYLKELVKNKIIVIGGKEEEEVKEDKKKKKKKKE